jgi:uncharacterized protein (DUF1330 family)
MSAVYAVLLVDEIQDPERYREYERRHDRAAFAAFGGDIVIKSDDPEVLEGEWPHARLVLLRFPSREALHAWYGSEHYAEVGQLRLAASRGRMACFAEFGEE